jgi:hypothetical protein
VPRSTFVRPAASILAIGGVWAGFTRQAPEPLTVEKIAGDLHVRVGSGGNVAVLTTSDGVILADDKFERNVPEILEKVKSITDKPIRYVINTHQHGDHTGGNQARGEGAKAVATQQSEASPLPYFGVLSTSSSQSGRLSTSRGRGPSGGPMIPSRSMASRMRAARP